MVLALDEPDVIVGVRVSSPLIVGLGDGENILASDIPAVLQKTRTVLPIDENQIVEVRADGVRVTDLDGPPTSSSSPSRSSGTSRAPRRAGSTTSC